MPKLVENYEMLATRFAREVCIRLGRFKADNLDEARQARQGPVPLKEFDCFEGYL